MTHNVHLTTAARDKYRRQTNKAELSDLLSMITGGNTDLVSYDEVARRLRARQQIDRGVQHVRLEKIVGSVGRYRDFTRTFLPRSGSDEFRWAKIDAAMNALEPLPPVELYKIGDVYFVRDGNHRVSVARANKLSHIEAYVTEVETDIPLTADDFERDQWIIKAERKEFLDQTNLDELRPENDFVLTEPGRYGIMLRHIETHRYFCNLELERAGNPHRMSWQEAVESWYDTVYMPIVAKIRERDLMKSFPNRTEADLYLWVTYHRERLAKKYELAPLTPDEAVATFAETHSELPVDRTVKTLRSGLIKTLGVDDRPLGMNQDEFLESRARRESGELSIGEVEETLEAENSSTDGAQAGDTLLDAA